MVESAAHRLTRLRLLARLAGFPACHLNQQDWGVPVRIVAGGPSELTLPLHG